MKNTIILLIILSTNTIYAQVEIDKEDETTSQENLDPNRWEKESLNESGTKYLEKIYENNYVRIERENDSELDRMDVIQYYPKSKIVQATYTMINGKFREDKIEYFKNGNILNKTSYNENGKQENYISYYLNGNKKEEVIQTKGIRSKSFSYYDSGALLKEGFFNKKDQRHGKWKYYFKNGELGIIIELENDKIIKRTTIKQGYIPNVLSQ